MAEKAGIFVRTIGSMDRARGRSDGGDHPGRVFGQKNGTLSKVERSD
ncbi:MAG: hypothetical protein MUP04_11495 [Anaerolineae bacterium]|nr:hypothetical protein [Anaerolineae bacterium]